MRKVDLDNRSQERRKKKIKINLIMVIVLLVSLALMAYPVGEDFAVHYLTQKNLQQLNENQRTMDKEKSKEQQRNMDQRDIDKKEITYNFADVTPISMMDIVEAINKKMPVAGTIKIPSVNINLPIIEGVSNSSMVTGGGTLKPSQVMGKGNYALASHNMKNSKLLFGPLEKISIGTKIYLSDGKDTYEYVVTKKEVINPSQTDVIKDKDGESLVTLITCTNNGKKRIVVVGKLVK
ncbi:class A sortase [Bacillus cereus]|uniref:Class A sortase n=1 Tax=Bacillus cereus TaxID=1396 RepID=A0A9X0MEE6_BACCE|nr:class A sortase [Bacillus cereus]HDR5278539.1 class A sortase [Bacillus thuringiensis]KXY35558.1 hypothetical protein AT268_34625 [Bacillus cereus]MBJ7968014.1 class A sortase [Bacillus cereus]MBJ8004398.1 class A sortase [Bacillus cereus]MCU5528848.1 class A sortase [Bacillus cereus]